MTPDIATAALLILTVALLMLGCKPSEEEHKPHGYRLPPLRTNERMRVVLGHRKTHRSDTNELVRPIASITDHARAIRERTERRRGVEDDWNEAERHAGHGNVVRAREVL